MKSLADIKRAMVVGSEWEAYSYFGGKSMGVAPIHRVQKNAVTFMRNIGNGKQAESWFRFPKASEVDFIDEDTFTVAYDGLLNLRYRRITS
tara:strand:- start:4172 stop:4444 length:273 start_codon:yes stop_codon:yes gene_type:complete